MYIIFKIHLFANGYNIILKIYWALRFILEPSMRGCINLLKWTIGYNFKKKYALGVIN